MEENQAKGLIEQHDELLARVDEARQAKATARLRVADRRADLIVEKQRAASEIAQHKKAVKKHKREFLKDAERKFWQLVHVTLSALRLKV
jgi:C4-dicarboxylate-specific signal transduction histidine kinase